MFNSTILDVAIGLISLYLLLALICTTVNEWISGIFKTRGKMLAEGLKNLLQGQTVDQKSLLDVFQAHPLIAGLRRDDAGPSYIAPRTFALAIMDVITPQQPGVITFEDLETGINKLPDGETKRSLLALIQNTNRNLDNAEAAIEGWFNHTMDRVSGWYTRHKQVLTVVISVILTLFVNADTIGIANKLWANPTLRQELVNHAKGQVTAEYKDTNPKPDKPEIKPALTQLQEQLGGVAGWSEDWNRAGKSFNTAFSKMVAYHIPGWILTIIAVSLGAPFWFDALKTFMNIRASGKPPAETPNGQQKTSAQGA